MEELEVKWKINLFKADAQKCFQEIGDENITAEKVLEIARNPKTELHKCFEWNDSVAAEKYRLQQAQTIIRNLVVSPRTVEEVPTRVLQISSQKGVYQPPRFFKQNRDEYQILLQRAKQELIAFKTRYKSLVELETVFDAIDEL